LWPVSRGWAFVAGAHAGALLQRRETLDTAPDVVARSAQWNAAVALGPEVQARVMLRQARVSLGAALDILPSPTRFVYRDGDGERAARQPWQVQARIFLSSEVSP
jgi:hypothetical protein